MELNVGEGMIVVMHTMLPEYYIFQTVSADQCYFAPVGVQAF